MVQLGPVPGWTMMMQNWDLSDSMSHGSMGRGFARRGFWFRAPLPRGSLWGDLERLSGVDAARSLFVHTYIYTLNFKRR